MILARQICKTALHLAVLGLAVCGVWAPYSINALYLLAALRALAGFVYAFNTRPSRNTATPKPISWLFWYLPVAVLALCGWWFCAAAFAVGAIGLEIHAIRFGQGGAK